MNRQLLCIDIGNSRIKVGFFTAHGLKEIKTLPSFAYEDSLFPLLKNQHNLPIVISSVVPSITESLLTFVKRENLQDYLVVDHNHTGELAIEVQNPQTIGPDRISAAAGAVAKKGCPCIVIDLGTATTTTVVAPDKKIVGGTIAPGIRMMLEALHEKTATLPKIEPYQWSGSFGIDTKSSIIAGVIFATVGMIEKVLEETRKIYKNLTVFVTGGQSELIRTYLRNNVIIEPHLTLFGMKSIFERSRK